MSVWEWAYFQSDYPISTLRPFLTEYPRGNDNQGLHGPPSWEPHTHKTFSLGLRGSQIKHSMLTRAFQSSDTLAVIKEQKLFSTTQIYFDPKNPAIFRQIYREHLWNIQISTSFPHLVTLWVTGAPCHLEISPVILRCCNKQRPTNSSQWVSIRQLTSITWQEK